MKQALQVEKQEISSKGRSRAHKSGGGAFVQVVVGCLS